MRSVRTRRRVAFYSHDTQGLGHIRRNIALAAAVAGARPDTDILLFSGAPEATVLPLPPATEVITLPAVGKDGDGEYAARVLDITLPDVLDLRSRLIASALESFAPDVLVVDKLARGIGGELDRALRSLGGHRADRPAAARTRVVLGLRDVLDAPLVTRREWHDQATDTTLSRYYDRVWVYGDPLVYDCVAEYGLSPEVAAKVEYTGYLGTGRGETVRVSAAAAGHRAVVPEGPYVLCMMGGGQDGFEVASAFAAAPLPAGHHGVIVTGPYLQQPLRGELQAVADQRSDLTVQEFVAGATALIAGAAAVVCMGGYNTVCEILAAHRPALVIPRVTPRTEQAIRADRLADLGLLDTIHPAALSPGTIAAWLRSAVGRAGRQHPGELIDLDGLRRIPALVDALLAGPVGVDRPGAEPGRSPALTQHGREVHDVAV